MVNSASFCTLPISRRLAGCAIVLRFTTTALLSASDPRAPATVLVVKGAKMPAFDEAVQGITSVLASKSYQVDVLELEGPNGQERLATALTKEPAVVVAVGSSAAEAVAGLTRRTGISGGDTSRLPPPAGKTVCGNASEPLRRSALVATMVLPPPAAFDSRTLASTVTLEVPHGAVLSRLSRMYPGRQRLCIVRGPALSDAEAAKVEAQARATGYTLQFLQCPGPKELLDRIGSLQDRTDFMWCLPDSKLYQGPTVSAIVLAAIRFRVPLIGFSEGFVRAGALVGFYPDYVDVGKQAAEVADRLTRGQAVSPIERARNFRVAVNERVTRILGISHTATQGVTVVK